MGGETYFKLIGCLEKCLGLGIQQTLIVRHLLHKLGLVANDGQRSKSRVDRAGNFRVIPLHMRQEIGRTCDLFFHFAVHFAFGPILFQGQKGAPVHGHRAHGTVQPGKSAVHDYLVHNAVVGCDQELFKPIQASDVSCHHIEQRETLVCLIEGPIDDLGQYLQAVGLKQAIQELLVRGDTQGKEKPSAPLRLQIRCARDG
mmetsp:Transcript_10986/g.27675  ORF Transcript_10986/g.27675 Transcript_10986/m.27675 type:complete len:200 (+) Transcript_10986:516-1115(+)